MRTMTHQANLYTAYTLKLRPVKLLLFIGSKSNLKVLLTVDSATELWCLVKF